MKSSALQLTLREAREQITSARVWGVTVTVALVLGISGPFQTFDLLPVGPRLAYWLVMTVACYWVGYFFGNWVSKLTDQLKVPFAFRFVLIGFAAGVPVTLVVILLNLAALNYGFEDIQGMVILGIYCIGISLGVVLMFQLFGNQNEECETDAKDKPAEPAKILSRIPVEKRGQLISMSVQDHYVQVVTSRGKHLTLIRLSDAISETDGTRGLQVHRSHWVAIDGVDAVNRDEGKVSIKTRAGENIPVSRTYVPRLKEVGLLI